MRKRFLTVNEVAEYLGFSDSAIRKWVRLGVIQFRKINGGIRFDIDHIDQWVEQESKRNNVLSHTF